MMIEMEMKMQMNVQTILRSGQNPWSRATVVVGMHCTRIMLCSCREIIKLEQQDVFPLFVNVYCLQITEDPIVIQRDQKTGIKVYASDTIQVLREDKAFSFQSLLADCGGVLGLFVGFNFLMIWDRMMTGRTGASGQWSHQSWETFLMSVKQPALNTSGF